MLANNSRAIQALSLLPQPASALANMPGVALAASADVPRRPNPEKIEALLRRVGTLKAERAKWAPHLRDAYDLFMPNRSAFKQFVTGAKRNVEVIDSVGVRTLKRWANRKQAQLMPANREFVRYVPGNEIPKEIQKQVATLLEDQNDRLFAELNHSNLFDQVNEALLDAGISTGAIHVADGGSDEKPLRFTAVSPDQMLFENGPEGSIENVYRTRQLTVTEIARLWPMGSLPPDIEPDSSKKLDVLEGQVFNVGRGDYDYVVIVEKSRHLVWHQVIPETEWVVFRAGKTSGETYGRGPALDALPDARTLQRVAELILRNGALAIAGVYTGTDDDVLNVWTVTLSPGAIIPVARHDSLKPLESSRDFQVGDFIRKELIDSIELTMEAQSLGPIEGAVRSATEILKVDQQIAEDTGASSARLQNELVDKIVRLSTSILIRRGKLAPFRLDNRQVAIRFEGPLARAQDNEEILRATTFLETAAPLGEQSLMMAVDPVILLRKMAQKSGVWAEAIRSEAESAQVQQAVAQAAGAQLAQDSGGQAGQGPPPQQGPVQ